MPGTKLINGLTQRFKAPLPGWDAQQRLIPEGREKLPLSADLIPAAVLIALFRDADEWVFPLIKRSSDGLAHSGQIALPGGRKEHQESITEAALREAWEEVHIDAAQVHVLGELSPLPIPVSSYLVHPIVGYLETAPSLIPDPREVASVFTVSVNALKQMDILLESRDFSGRIWDIPYLDIDGHKVWGATAMILSEFRELLTSL